MWLYIIQCLLPLVLMDTILSGQHVRLFEVITQLVCITTQRTINFLWSSHTLGQLVVLLEGHTSSQKGCSLWMHEHFNCTLRIHWSYSVSWSFTTVDSMSSNVQLNRSTNPLQWNRPWLMMTALIHPLRYSTDIFDEHEDHLTDTDFLMKYVYCACQQPLDSGHEMCTTVYYSL